MEIDNVFWSGMRTCSWNVVIMCTLLCTYVPWSEHYCAKRSMIWAFLREALHDLSILARSAPWSEHFCAKQPMICALLREAPHNQWGASRNNTQIMRPIKHPMTWSLRAMMSKRYRRNRVIFVTFEVIIVTLWVMT